MPRYKDTNSRQGKFVSIYFEDQILPGTFEHTLNRLIDSELDLGIFDERYRIFLGDALQQLINSGFCRDFFCRGSGKTWKGNYHRFGHFEESLGLIWFGNTIPPILLLPKAPKLDFSALKCKKVLTIVQSPAE